MPDNSEARPSPGQYAWTTSHCPPADLSSAGRLSYDCVSHAASRVTASEVSSAICRPPALGCDRPVLAPQYFVACRQSTTAAGCAWFFSVEPSQGQDIS